jgi:poly-gamma-glutamate synthesis protein (capsule biosynthesis protein)
VLQPVEWVTRADGTKGLVAFSLGNLVSNQDASDAAGLARDGLLLELVIEKGSHGAELQAVGGVPIGTENRQGRGRARVVQPVLLNDEIDAMLERVAVLRARDDAGSKAELKVLGKRLDVARARLVRINAMLGPAAAQ